MHQLDLDSVIDIYLGETIMDGLDIDQSKEMAYKEIKKRTLEYRKINNVDNLVLRLNSVVSQLYDVNRACGKNLTISFVDRDFMRDEVSQIVEYSQQKFHPYLNLLQDYYSLTSNLTEIWSNDPEHIRHISKFFDRRDNFLSQEYFKIYVNESTIFTAQYQWSYENCATLGFDYMKGIVDNCVKSDICILPLNIRDINEYGLSLIFNFLVLYNVAKSKYSTLWFVFFANNEYAKYTETIIENIRSFACKLFRKSHFTIDLVPYTIVTQNETGNWQYDSLLKSLDDFADKYIDQLKN